MEIEDWGKAQEPVRGESRAGIPARSAAPANGRGIHVTRSALQKVSEIRLSEW